MVGRENNSIGRLVQEKRDRRECRLERECVENSESAGEKKRDSAG